MVERRQQDHPVAVERRRGRPPSGTARHTFVKIRVRVEEKQRLKAVASLNGLHYTAFVRQAIEEAAADCSDEPIFST